MAEGMTASIDPVTGERRETRFQYTPVPPADTTGMGGLNPEAVARLFQQQRVDDAIKAVDAAIQFQGLRGYQQALKNGESAEKAMVRYGPMIFKRASEAFAPSVRALTPPVPKPDYKFVPPANGIPGHFAAQGQRPAFIPQSAMPPDLTLQKPKVTEVAELPGTKVIQVPGSKHYQVVPGEKAPVVSETTRQVPNKDFIPGSAGSPFITLTNRTVRGMSPAKAASPQPSTPIALPADKSQLKRGQKYSTSRGEATWDGEKFVK